MTAVRLTGILSTGGEHPGYRPPWGTMITKDGLYAPIHQHFWVVRMDMAVDGVNNTVMEVNAVRGHVCHTSRHLHQR